MNPDTIERLHRISNPRLSEIANLIGAQKTIFFPSRFGVLLLSQVPANARLGILLVLGLVNCFIVSLLLLPVLLNSCGANAGTKPIKP